MPYEWTNINRSAHSLHCPTNCLKERLLQILIYRLPFPAHAPKACAAKVQEASKISRLSQAHSGIPSMPRAHVPIRRCIFVQIKIKAGEARRQLEEF